MPRLPRSWTLHKGLAFHKTWRGHNKEWNLTSHDEKNTYLNYLYDEHRKSGSLNPLHALCLMSNHSHEVYSLIDLTSFSHFMRQHHSRYGLFFNRKHHRSGKVAQDRPRTSSIENDYHEMIVTFYIHANPVRAGICKDAKDYVWSTHMFYAFGKKPKWMKHVKISLPEWYLSLGRTSKERQQKYRRYFDAYLREYGLIKRVFSIYGIGSYTWCAQNKAFVQQLKRLAANKNALGPPV